MQQGLLVLNNRIFLLLLSKAQHTDELASPTLESVQFFCEMICFRLEMKSPKRLDENSTIVRTLCSLLQSLAEV